MINPFDHDGPVELLNIVSGVIAKKEASEDLARAYEAGDENFRNYIRESVISESPCIFDTIKLMKLKTFAEKAKQVKNSKGEVVLLKEDSRFWMRLLLIAKSRDVDLKEVMTFSLRTYQVPLATNAGCLKKTTKSKLMEHLEQVTGMKIH